MTAALQARNQGASARVPEAVGIQNGIHVGLDDLIHDARGRRRVPVDAAEAQMPSWMTMEELARSLLNHVLQI